VAARCRADGLPVLLGGIEKMSKSKNNVVEPGTIIARFGADTARAFVMFAGPPEQSAAWSDAGAEGTHRFLRRLWAFCAARSGAAVPTDANAAASHAEGASTGKQAAEGSTGRARGNPADRRFELHRVLGQICHDYERLQFNTVVSGAMKLLNLLEDAARAGDSAAALEEGSDILLRVLYPVAPHICQVLWDETGGVKRLGELWRAPWPEPDAAALQRDQVEMVVQVNGKLRGAVRVPAGADAATVEAAVRADTDLARHISAPVRKLIVVPGKLVNVVV
jgi:leucyl-tRNA synthetase